jgi:hypothetical protein
MAASGLIWTCPDCPCCPNPRPIGGRRGWSHDSCQPRRRILRIRSSPNFIISRGQGRPFLRHRSESLHDRRGREFGQPVDRGPEGRRVGWFGGVDGKSGASRSWCTPWVKMTARSSPAAHDVPPLPSSARAAAQAGHGIPASLTFRTGFQIINRCPRSKSKWPRGFVTAQTALAGQAHGQGRPHYGDSRLG